MKSLSRALLILAATALVATGFATRAEAVSIGLASVTVNALTVEVDVFVNDLSQPLGGYQFQLEYNTADLTGNSFTNDPTNKLGDGAGNTIFDFSGGFNCALCDPPPVGSGPIPGILDVIVLSGFTDLAALTSAQEPFLTSFLLTHVVFDRTPGTARTDLRLLNMGLSDFYGNSIPAVPEPTTMLLLGTGLVATAAARRRKQSKSQR